MINGTSFKTGDFSYFVVCNFCKTISSVELDNLYSIRDGKCFLLSALSFTIFVCAITLIVITSTGDVKGYLHTRQICKLLGSKQTSDL